MSQQDNFPDPRYSEGAPDSSGNIVNTYTVEEKDTLQEIARKFGLSIEDLLQANAENIPDAAHMVQTGTRIMIPNKGGTRE